MGIAVQHTPFSLQQHDLGHAGPAVQHPLQKPLSSPTASPQRLRPFASKSLRFQRLYPYQSENKLLNPDHTLETFRTHLRQVTTSVTHHNRMEKIAQLTEVVDQFLQGNARGKGKLKATLSALKTMIKPIQQGSMVMAQINPYPANVEHNAQTIMKYITVADAIGIETIVFPEMSLIGYPIRDVVTRFPWLMKDGERWLNAIAKQTTGNTKAIIGFVQSRPNQPVDGRQAVGRRFYNAAALVGDGQVQQIVRKQLLPTYAEFDDYRHFEPGERNQPIFHINGQKVGVVICEDGWNDFVFFKDPYRSLYQHDPVSDLLARHPDLDLIINVSASPSRSRKSQLKHNMLKAVSARHQKPYLYVNQVGAIDENSFDGASSLYLPYQNDSHTPESQLVSRAKSFEEQFMVINPYEQGKQGRPFPGKLYPIYDSTNSRMTSNESEFNPFSESDLPRVYATLVQATRDYFMKRGYNYGQGAGYYPKAVLGLSGGLDSAVCATLLADALGPDNVIAIRMPSEITSDASNDEAQQLADKLGITLITLPIGESASALETQLESIETQLMEKGFPAVHSDKKRRAHTYRVAMGNVQARLRLILNYAVNNLYGALPVATSDKSELYVGYTSLYGDSAGEFGPIKDVPKCQVRQLARWMNRNRPKKNAIPWNTINKASGAELEKDPETGAIVTAEKDLMPYPFLDELIWRHEALRQSPEDMKQANFWYERNYTSSRYGFDKKGAEKGYPEPTQANKDAWVDKFFSKMNRSYIKWWASPPGVVVSGWGSVLGSDYTHPITSYIYAQPNDHQMDDQLQQAAKLNIAG